MTVFFFLISYRHDILKSDKLEKLCNSSFLLKCVTSSLLSQYYLSTEIFMYQKCCMMNFVFYICEMGVTHHEEDSLGDNRTFIVNSWLS